MSEEGNYKVKYQDLLFYGQNNAPSLEWYQKKDILNEFKKDLPNMQQDACRILGFINSKGILGALNNPEQSAQYNQLMKSFADITVNEGLNCIKQDGECPAHLPECQNDPKPYMSPTEEGNTFCRCAGANLSKIKTFRPKRSLH